MSILFSLRAAKTLSDVASLLGYKPSALSYILFKIAKADRYKVFEIKKRTGGERRIDAPNPKLKAVQRRLADVLYECLGELEDGVERKNRLSHAFRRNYSIITNANAHTSRRYVLNIDLSDFFPSLNFGRVRGFFLKNKQFELAEPVATVIAQIACNDGVLPQGSPCSPIVSEFLTHFLDMRLVKLAARNRCSYTRYADDITFSTNQRQFPPALAAQVGADWVLGNELNSRIKDAGFKVNGAKTRMQLRGSRQTVTGLTVNNKVNVPQRYYKLARAMTHSFLTTGKYEHDGNEETSVLRLEGILNHIYHIRERRLDLLIESEKNEERRRKLRAERTIQKNERPSAIRLVYFRLVFFKHFVDPPKPLIICEGPTDPVYLKCAIRKLAASHPNLISFKDGKTSINAIFFKYSRQSRDILQLRGGSSDIKFFIQSWKEKLVTYKHRPMAHPVIVLIDNDDGAKEIFKLLQGKKFGLSIGLAVDEPFYHLDGPLYLIKTPAKGVDHKSCPEDFFDPALLATKIDGKSFNPNKEHEADGEYGKVVFAERVVRPQADTIDFSGFDPILARIEAVLADYTSRKAAAASSTPPVPASPVAKSAVKSGLKVAAGAS